MKRQLEQIFNECLERMQQGEAIDSCLRSYPEQADELEPLLRTFLNVRWRGSTIEPRPQFKAVTRARLQDAYYYAHQQPKRGSFFSLHRAWASALIAIIIFLPATAGTVAASSDALPDEVLYPVKQASENVRIAFTFSDTSKARLHVQLAEERAQEIAFMAIQGKTEQIAALTDNLSRHLDEAQVAITNVEVAESRQVLTTTRETTLKPPSKTPDSPTAATPVKPEDSQKGTSSEPEETLEETAPEPEKSEAAEAKQLRQFLKTSISNNVAVMENALNKAPEQAKPALQQAIDISKKSRLLLPKEDKSEADNKDKPTFVKPKDIQSPNNDSQKNQHPTTKKETQKQTQQETKAHTNNESASAEIRRVQSSDNATENR